MRLIMNQDDLLVLDTNYLLRVRPSLKIEAKRVTCSQSSAIGAMSMLT